MKKKYIVELDEGAIEFAKNFFKEECEDFDVPIVSAIANATPYNPSGDAISREALRKQMNELLDLSVRRVNDTPNNSPCYRMYVAQESERARLIDLIDNAQTVEPERTQCNQIVWEQGYECGYHQAKEDVIRRIKEQYNEHHELIPYWLSVGDVRGGTE